MVTASITKTRNFLLSKMQVHGFKKEKVKTDVAHIFVIDCSGSMYRDLPKVKDHLKNKLPTLMEKGHTFSLIYFSGKGQFGVLQKDVELKSLSDFNSYNSAIDKLEDIGLTGFKEPLTLARDIAKDIKSKNSNRAVSLFFMSDGYDNCWNKKEILEEVKANNEFIDQQIFVEYGNYANKELLNSMSLTGNGISLFSEDFYNFSLEIDKVISSSSISANKIKVQLPEKAYFAYSLTDNGNIVCYSIQDDGSVLIGEDVSAVNYFSKEESDYCVVDQVTKDKYAALYLASKNSLTDEVYSLLDELGDKHLIDMFSNSFGKQKINQFETEVKNIVEDVVPSMQTGRVFNYLPKEDAFCVLDLLNLIAENDCKGYFNLPDFKYSSIGSKRVNTNETYTKEELEILKEMNVIISSPDSSIQDKKAATEKITEISNSKYKLDMQVADIYEPTRMYEFVYNESRANVSVSTTKTVKLFYDQSFVNVVRKKFRDLDFDLKNPYLLDLEQKLNAPGANYLDSKIFRNYTIISDGNVNCKKIYVNLKNDMKKILDENNVSYKIAYSITLPNSIKEIYEVDLDGLPVVSKKYVNNISATSLFKNQFDLLQMKANFKLFNYYNKQVVKKAVQEEVRLVNNEEEQFKFVLKEFGITDEAYSPKTVEVKSGESYPIVKFGVEIEKMNTLPDASKVVEKYEKSKTDSKVKFTPRELLMLNAAKHYVDNIKGKENEVELISDELERINIKKKAIMFNLNVIKFSTILSRKWFSEFSSRDENTLTLTDVFVEPVTFKVSIEDTFEFI